MNATRHGLLLTALLALVPAVSALGQAPAAREPRVGYVFPAGAKAGSTVELLVGGQMLRGASQVVVSGSGLTAKVLKAYRPIGNLDKEQREEIQRRIISRRAVLAGKEPPPAKKRPADAPAFVMPEHPFLDRLEHADLAELEHIVQIFLRANRMQKNVQLAEMVTLEVKVDPAAAPGIRELRLLGPAGLTNPMRFDVGTTDEACEREPNDPKPWKAPSLPVASLPVAFNGQVLPGDVDRLRFHARRGQSLVLEVQARSLIPYLADAVPGWFQPVVAVFDPQGKEFAYGDDFRFRPDPVLMFRVPTDGDYTLEIRDSLFRGREDFVYRVKLSEQPFVTSCYPLGAAAGSTTAVRLSGWNLPRNDVALDTRPDGDAVRDFTVNGRGMVSNHVAYAVDDLPDAAEVEPNNARENASAVPWPCVVNGRIDKPGDIDVFQVSAPAGASMVAEVWARRLGSPLDSVVRVTDAAGKVLTWNDDLTAKEGQLYLGDGLLTHHADSRVALSLPSKGPFYVRVGDAQHQGGEAFGYRLRIAPAKPDFALRVNPSGLNVAPGQSVPVTVHIDRRDGFSAPVKLSLDGVPAGWMISGGVVPPGCEHLRFTVQVPQNAEVGVRSLHLTGKAMVGGVEITRVAEASDDTMQAFLWRHLVPAREWMAAVSRGKGRPTPATRVGEGAVSVPAGGEAVVRYRVPAWIASLGVEVVAVEAPEGLAVRSETRLPDEVVVHLTADSAKLKPGSAGNLIFGASIKLEAPAKDAKTKGSARRGPSPVVVLPALPFTIKQELPKP